MNAPYGFVYNSFVAGKKIAAFREVETSTLLTADGKHDPTPAVNGDPTTVTYQGIAYSAADLAFRHTGEINLSYTDGHATSTKDTRQLPIEFRLAPAAEFDGFDTSVRGNWWTPAAVLRTVKLADGTAGSIASQSAFGSQGYVLCNWDGSGNAVTNLPNATSYVASVTQTGLTSTMWAAATSDPRALTNPQGGQAAACWTGNGSIAITLQSSTDTDIHTLHIYCVDWNSAKLTMKLDVMNPVPSIPATPTAPATYTSMLKTPVSVLNFSNGTWLYFRFRGNITLNLQGTGNTQAVILALLFD